MILGGELPVALPTMSWYDKDAFKMYITALKDDYDKAIEEEKNFFDKYSDIAATDADRQYMANNVINPIVNFVLDNPDAIRSVLGRAMLRLLRNSINPEAIAKIKGTAKMADTYNKVKAQMIADGTYSEDMLKAMDVDLSSWDSANKGAFQQAAPYKLDHIEDLLLPTIKQLGNAYRYNEALTKSKNDGKRYSTVSDQQIYDSLNGDYVDLMQRPSMQYHLKKYLQSNPDKTEEDFKNELFKQVRGQLGEKTETDELYLNNLKFRQQVYLENLNHQHARQRQRELLEAKHNNNDYPQLTSRLALDSNNAFKINSLADNNVNYFVNYFTALAKNTKNQNHKTKYLQYAQEWKNYGGLSEGKKVAFLKKYGYIEPNYSTGEYQYTKKYYKYLANASKTGGLANGYIIGKKGNLKTITVPEVTVSNALDFQLRNAASVSEQTVNSALKTKFKKIGNYYQFTFGNNGRMTSVDAMNVQGVKRHRTNRYDLADNWLRTNKITGNVYDSEDAYQRTGNNKVSFSNLGVTVPLHKLDGLVMYLRQHGVHGKDADVLGKVGITVVDNKNRDVKTLNNRVDAKGRQSSYTTSKQKGMLYARIPATFDVAGDDALTNLNNTYIKDNASNKYTYEEYPNSYEATEDAQ